MKKIVEVNDDSIYKKIKLYKSFLYKNTEFIYKGNNDNVKNIVRALNIKKRMKRLEFIYDECCKAIDKNFEGMNICDFECNHCIAQRKAEINEINGCCRLCRFQTNTGCQTTNLTCKLFFCDEIKKNYKTIKLSDIGVSKILTLRQRLILKFDLFSLKEEVLTDLYLGFVTFTASRLIISSVKNALYLLFKYKKKINKNSKAIDKTLVSIIILMLVLFFASTYPVIFAFSIVLGMNQILISKLYKSKKEEIEKEN